MQKLGKAGAGNPRTNLIIHHGVANILDKAAKFIRILGAIQELRDLASLFHASEVPKDIVKFPSKSHVRLDPGLGEDGLPFEDCPSLFLLELSLRNRRTQRFRKPFDSGYQRFYRLPTRHRLLRQL